MKQAHKNTLMQIFINIIIIIIIVIIVIVYCRLLFGTPCIKKIKEFTIEWLVFWAIFGVFWGLL